MWSLLAMVLFIAAGCEGMSMNFPGRAPQIGTPSVPEGQEAYTVLLCPPYQGADHARDSAEAKRKTESATGWQGVYVVHEDRSSGLYLGRYATEGEAIRDLQKVRQWKTSQGALPFQYALVTKRAGQRVGPPEWDLASAPGYYTVVIAEFYNEPGFAERMQLAVENCRDLRQKGVEAYYHHGPTKSYVTVGSFPVEAYRMEERGDGRVQAAIEDERLARVLKERPHLAVNGYLDKVTGTNAITGVVEIRYTSTYVTSISDFRSGRAGPVLPTRRQPERRQGP